MARRFSPPTIGKHGREPLWDCVEAKKYLASLGYVDREEDRHHGRHLTAATWCWRRSLSSRRSLKSALIIFGVSNWVRTLQTIPPYWESFRKSLYKEIGDPKTELEILRETSPLFHADKIAKPLIVLAGRERPARDQAGVGRDRRRDQEEERHRRIRRLRQRGPRLHQEGQRDSRLQSDSRFPRQISERQRRAAGNIRRQLTGWLTRPRAALLRAEPY